MYKKFIKQLIDFALASIGLLIISPIFLIITIGLYFANQGKPFFYQTRPGKNERLFVIIKFKTMNDKRDSEGNLLPDALRLTKIGKFVRKTSLDEIPQLINVLKGDMSLIGPRPLLPEYLSIYNEIQRKRHEVKPGITGWAQVNGRNVMKFSDRLKHDIYYVKNVNFFFDVKILLKTINNIFFKSQNIVIGQTVDEIDDIGLSVNLSKNHFKEKI